MNTSTIVCSTVLCLCVYVLRSLTLTCRRTTHKQNNVAHIDACLKLTNAACFGERHRFVSPSHFLFFAIRSCQKSRSAIQQTHTFVTTEQDRMKEWKKNTDGGEVRTFHIPHSIEQHYTSHTSVAGVLYNSNLDRFVRHWFTVQYKTKERNCSSLALFFFHSVLLEVNFFYNLD